MMESTRTPSSERDVRDALAEAERSQNVLVDAVSYPPGYLALATGSGACLPLGGVASADGTPFIAQSVCWLLFAAGVIISGVALRRFREHNQVRVSGFRYGRGLAAAYLAAIVALVIGVGILGSTTDLWWAGLFAVPVAGVVSYLYQRRWLTTFRRQARR